MTATRTVPDIVLRPQTVCGELADLSRRLDVALRQDAPLAELAALARCAEGVRVAHSEAIRAALGEPDEVAS